MTMRRTIGTRSSARRAWTNAIATMIAPLALFAACGSTPVVLPSQDFDRPTDMAFACLGIFPDGVQGEPMDRCQQVPPATPTTNPSGVKPGQLSPDGVVYKTFAFVTNTERGDLSVVDLSYCRSNDSTCYPPGASIVDLDPNSLGYNAAPVGEFPEAVAASQDGCRLVTANRDSCDLTMVAPATLLTPHLTGGGTLGPYAKTFPVRTGAGQPLRVAPGEIAFIPQQTAGLPRRSDDPTTTPVICDPGSVNGMGGSEGTMAAPVGDPPVTSTASPASWHAVVTFPSCDLVALVDLPSGAILDSYQVKLNGDSSAYVFSATGTEPSCPIIDCIPDATATGSGAGGAPPDNGIGGAGGSAGTGGTGGGTGSSTPLEVKALALRPDGSRVYFGATNSPVVGALKIQGDALSVPDEGGSTALVNALGVTRLRLSVDPFDKAPAAQLADPTKPEYGRFVAEEDNKQMQFLYAVARDASLRVMDVYLDPNATTTPTAPFECDVGVDPTDPKIAAFTDPTLAGANGAASFNDPARNCFKYGTVRRLPQATTDGLRFPSAVQDIAFGYYWTPPTTVASDPNAEPTNEIILNGAFGFVLTSTGAVYIVNIDPAIRQTGQLTGDLNAMPPPVASLQPESPLPLPNSLRDSNVVTFTAGLGPLSGPPRLDTAPIALSTGPTLRVFQAYVTRENSLIVPLFDNGVPTAPSPPEPSPTYVFFPNRASVTPQTWGVTWEGALAGTRFGGTIDPTHDPDGAGPVSALTDYGGSFCTSTGVRPGDVVTLLGCDTDSICGPGRACVHSQRAPASVEDTIIHGLCFPQARADNSSSMAPGFPNSPTCQELLQTFGKYEVLLPSVTPPAGQNPVDPQITVLIQPKKAEVPLTASCVDIDAITFDGASGPANCPPADFPDLQACPAKGLNTDPDTVGCFRCINQPGTDVDGRCLMRCNNDLDCRTGRICVAFPTGSFCAEGAPIDTMCGLDQLTSYTINAGNSFLVQGSASGLTETGVVVPAADGTAPGTTPAPAQCGLDTSNPLMVARIPIRPPACTSPTPFDPLVPPAEAAYNNIFADPVIRPMPNPCLLETGDGTPTGTVSALFQNSEIRFVLTNMQTTVGDPVQISFTVDGGTGPQQVASSIDVSLGLPARIVVGPVSSADPSIPLPIPPTSGDGFDGFNLNPLVSNMPYLFVIDQRQLIGGRVGVRGQLARIAPRIINTTTSPIAAFDGFASSNQYFPIQ